MSAENNLHAFLFTQIFWMLHKDSFIISENTFLLIQELQQHSALKDFFLVGGTSLALQLGHRNSVDIDLFTLNEFSTDELILKLKPEFEVIPTLKKEKDTLLSEIRKVKTDFIRHNYPLVKAPITEEGITFLSCEDIAAMKLNAITNSGKRLKDFIDIYFLLEKFSIHEMIKFFEIKYPKWNPLMALKAVTFFGDIDPEMDPPKMKKNIPLEKIQARIEQAVLHMNRKF